jgi:tetratricopeptide (TPR) repeat protein
LEAAERAFQDAIRTGEETLRASPASPGSRRDLALAHVSLGDLYGGPFHINLGDPARAEPQYRRAIELAEDLVRRDARNIQARVQMLQARRRLGTALRGRDPRSSLAIATEVLAAYEALIKAEPGNSELRRDHGFTLIETGLAQEALGNRTAAGAALKSAIEAQSALVRADPARTQFRQDMAATHLFAARLEAADGRAGAARGHLSQALELAKAQRAASPLNLYSFRNLADCFEAHGELEAAEGGVGAASEWLAKAAAVWDEWESAHGTNRFVAARKARIASAAGRLGAK